MNTRTEFLTLLQISDSIFPIGSYTQSNGLETYVQKGIIKDVETSKKYLEKMLLHNMKYGDILAVKLSYEAAKNKDLYYITTIDNWVSSSKTPREIKEGSTKLCFRFIKLVEKLKPTEIIEEYENFIKVKKCCGQHSVAFGIFAAECGIEKKETLMAYVYNQASCIVNNCAKLIPLGQMEGQKILFEMQDTMNNVIEDLDELSIEDLGRCSIGFDIRAMQHEDLYSRMYMS
ncbi:urease accessory protein UreF [Clostridium sp. DJ247]|uniref:urease accessory protein UreF n=1 Tax=Clostridium sp. DJ247 TaxID=2726188 RepID=UPI0016278145|nr:urease accessory protein UreF [Clostridium sp. DJ247]MBC2581208.1 urease accessory protein UreF [Clostridium sp. DJ247]